MLTFIFITYIIQDDDDDSSLAALVKVGVTISNFLEESKDFSTELSNHDKCKNFMHMFMLR